MSILLLNINPSLTKVFFVTFVIEGGHYDPSKIRYKASHTYDFSTK